MPPSHHKLDLGQSFNLLIFTSPISVPTLDILISFRSSDLNNIEHPLLSIALLSFLNADNTLNFFIFMYI